jgi:hypothetical protein
MTDFEIHWIDRGREPACAPDPTYPNGIDVVIGDIDKPGCSTELPYPAPRCGLFFVQCKTCGTNAIITTAGRPDDPRSVRLPCDKPVMLQ